MTEVEFFVSESSVFILFAIFAHVLSIQPASILSRRIEQRGHGQRMKTLYPKTQQVVYSISARRS
jgi:hypothetical protein